MLRVWLLTLVLAGDQVEDGEEADEVPHLGADYPPLHSITGLAMEAFTQTSKSSERW